MIPRDLPEENNHEDNFSDCDRRNGNMMGENFSCLNLAKSGHEIDDGFLNLDSY